MTEREILMRKISTVEFAIVDLNLFLNTHPQNREIIEKIGEYENKAKKLRQQYEKKFGLLTASSEDDNKWRWISSPWPWENKFDEE